MDLLNGLWNLAGVPTRQVSGENPTGAKGGACKWEPDPSNPEIWRAGENLGKGWKLHPFAKAGAGETVVLADIEGPGIVNEIFFTCDTPRWSELVLRIYWDGEAAPSVECPVGAFFCAGFDGHPRAVNSLPVVVAPDRGMNGYWQMPFRRHARITLTNESANKVDVIAYRVLYKLLPVDDGAAYFHAQYRRSTPPAERPEHTILDGVRGKGLYVGTYLMWNARSPGWWGEGEVKFFLDGDTDQPTLCDNGTEDYFGGAWGFLPFEKKGAPQTEQTFSTPFLGLPLAVADDPDGSRKFGLYRWHILDSIGFERDIRVTVQTLGWYPDGHFRPRTEDDIASVAYWYQTEPHAPFPVLPAAAARGDR